MCQLEIGVFKNRKFMVSMIGSGTDGASNRVRAGQIVIAVTGTAIALPTLVGYNGIVLTAKAANNAAGMTIGSSTVTNTVNGTGNGYILAPGASVGVATSQFNQLYVNGTVGDIVSYLGT